MPRRRAYTARLIVRLGGDERRRLRLRARTAGLSLSRYLVEAGLATCTAPRPEDRALRERTLFHLRKVGVNLNQIARRLNANGATPPPALDRALRELTATLREFGREP